MLWKIQIKVFYNGLTGTITVYASDEELIAALVDDPKYISVVNKLKEFAIETKFIEDNNLPELDTTEQILKEYIEKYQKGSSLKSAAGQGFLYDGKNCTGANLAFTGISNPRMSKNNWDRASSWNCITGGSIILCGQTWYKGSKKVIYGLPLSCQNLADWGFDNNTRSFF